MITLCVSLLFIYVTVRFCLSKIYLPNVTSRHVFITGCDTGIGYLLARTLDAKGVRVFAGCLTESGASELRDVTSSRLNTVIVDISNEVSVKKAFTFVQKNLPAGEGLWGVVNNAGVLPNYGPVEWNSIADVKATCDVNLFGTISVTLTFLPLVKRAGGRVVTVTSSVASFPNPGTATYCVSKAGLKMFIDTLRLELYNSGVTFHSIEPSGCTTNMTNMTRLLGIVHRAYQQATPELQEYYGGNIATSLFRAGKYTELFVRGHPQDVADPIAHALLARYPDRIYRMGNIWFFIRALMYLPQWVGDRVLGWPKPYRQTANVLLQTS